MEQTWYSSSSEPSSNPENCRKSHKKKMKNQATEQHQESPPLDSFRFDDSSWPRKNSGVMLEGYVESADGGDQGSDGGDSSVGRTKSLTDDDLEELKGCLDLGFGFSYEEIPELCNTLPALELCYSMSQRFLDEQQQQRAAADETAGDSCANASSGVPIANWKISSPGDHPEEVKARLKYWAQAVACTVRLCN